eukprot:38891-Pyramimonas_sp.AAC.1
MYRYVPCKCTLPRALPKTSPRPNPCTPYAVSKPNKRPGQPTTATLNNTTNITLTTATTALSTTTTTTA